jgi:hypothetical protein
LGGLRKAPLFNSDEELFVDMIATPSGSYLGKLQRTEKLQSEIENIVKA